VPDAHVNGVRLSYLDEGSGTPVLFIHGGYGGAASTLSPTPHAIRGTLPLDRFRLITYDRRNAGASEYVDTPYTLRDLAEDGAALLDHAGVGQAIIIGTSAGGPIAQQFALTWPERVIALCLPNTGPNLMNPEREVSRQRQELVERFRAQGARTVFEQRKHRLRVPPPAAEPPPGGEASASERRARLERALAELPEEDLFRYSTGEIRNFEAYIGFDFTDRLGDLKMPVCIIHGDADQTVPYSWGETLHRGIPGSEFHTIKGGRHGIVGNPEAQVILRDWALRVSGRSSESQAAK
jgi:3-oxoadipate enol-lactonase